MTPALSPDHSALREALDYLSVKTTKMGSYRRDLEKVRRALAIVEAALQTPQTEHAALIDRLHAWGENSPDPDWFAGDCLNAVLSDCSEASRVLSAFVRDRAALLADKQAAEGEREKLRAGRDSWCALAGENAKAADAANTRAAALAEKVDRLEAENARLFDALEPFSVMAGEIERHHPGWDHDEFWFRLGGGNGPEWTLKPFRAARKLRLSIKASRAALTTSEAPHADQ